MAKQMVDANESVVVITYSPLVEDIYLKFLPQIFQIWINSRFVPVNHFSYIENKQAVSHVFTEKSRLFIFQTHHCSIKLWKKYTKACIPFRHVGRCNFSFGPWMLSSNNEKPVNTESIPNEFLNINTAPIPPPDRWKMGSFPKTV